MENAPKIDFVIVTYNSIKWIDNCLLSISKLDYPKDKIKVLIYDNGSNDYTIENAEKLLANCSLAFEIISSKKNIGFGAANNFAAKKGEAPYIFCLNVDTEIYPDCLKQWLNYTKTFEQTLTASWEMAQQPYSHPKIYNPATLNVSWSSAAAIIYDRVVFEKVNGFDNQIFMYCEDLDISWRFRALGYQLKYLPFAKVIHHSYTNHYGSSIKIVNALINNILLRYRYGDVKTIIKGYFQLLKGMRFQLKGNRLKVWGVFFNHFSKIPYFLSSRVNFPGRQFYYWEFEYHKYGDDLVNKELVFEHQPLVSIIIRTYQRPDVLKEAIQSVLFQTYTNWELIVAEDGGETAKAMCENFGDDRIIYVNEIESVGRCEIGNKGLKIASGEYFNFLDDDDFLFHDHIEKLVYHIQNTHADAVYALAIEAKCVIDPKNQINYKIKQFEMPIFQEFSRITLSTMNFIPIQAILFKKTLYQKYGGFDLALEYLEDWDLWYRYGINSDFRLLPRVTSVYKTPYAEKERAKRQNFLDKNILLIKEKYRIQSELLLWGNGLNHINMMNSYIAQRTSLTQFVNTKRKTTNWKGKIAILPIFIYLKVLEKFFNIKS